MRALGEVPLGEQVLRIEGRASEAAITAARGGLPDTWDTGCLLLFVSFSYADLPLGSGFDCCFTPDDPAHPTQVKATAIAVTQQFARGFDELPHGWKTLTLFRFDPSPPDLVLALPELDGWDHNTRLLLSSDQARLAYAVGTVRR